MKSDVENTDSLSKCNQHLENCIRDLDWEVTSPEDILSWATKEFGSRAVLATSFQRSGMVMFHMAYSAGIPLRIATCLLYTSPSPRDRQKSRMPSSA